MFPIIRLPQAHQGHLEATHTHKLEQNMNMRISDIIRELQAVQDAHGDLTVVGADDSSSHVFPITRDYCSVGNLCMLSGVRYAVNVAGESREYFLDSTDPGELADDLEKVYLLVFRW